MERMADRLASRPEVMDRRRESVEHPFGTIKQCMEQGLFLTRRLTVTTLHHPATRGYNSG